LLRDAVAAAAVETAAVAMEEGVTAVTAAMAMEVTGATATAMVMAKEMMARPMLETIRAILAIRR
jgi:hypothetical protein